MVQCPVREQHYVAGEKYRTERGGLYSSKRFYILQRKCSQRFSKVLTKSVIRYKTITFNTVH